MTRANDILYSTLETEKPYRGRIEPWMFRRYAGGETIAIGIFLDHPTLTGHFAQTSLIMREHGHEIETLNSRYTLVGEAKTFDEIHHAFCLQQTRIDGLV